MGEHAITNIMKVCVTGTSLQESEKKVYESQCIKINSQQAEESNIVSSEYIANVTGHRGINFLKDYDEADEEERMKTPALRKK